VICSITAPLHHILAKVPTNEDCYDGDDSELRKDCQNSRAREKGGANLINHKSEQLHFFPLDIHPPHCKDSPGTTLACLFQ
jgi:hypothetical protein